MVPTIKSFATPKIQQEDARHIPKEYKEVAEGMESEFINFLLTEMRKTINKEDEDSTAVDFYESMLDNEYSQIMAKTRGGVGLQKIIIDQIYPQQVKRNLHLNNLTQNPGYQVNDSLKDKK